jgi:Macrocin-O-methyltransferase (TylF)
MRGCNDQVARGYVLAAPVRSGRCRGSRARPFERHARLVSVQSEKAADACRLCRYGAWLRSQLQPGDPGLGLGHSRCPAIPRPIHDSSTSPVSKPDTALCGGRVKASYPKYLLSLLGARLSPSHLYGLQAVVNHLKLGRWMCDHGFQFDGRLSDRWEVFDVVASRVQDRRVLYLEFGVFRGRTTRYWSARLRNPESQLHGFDSFEGLPEEWAGHPKGQIFNALGQVPSIDDARVRFFKGWFDQVLPTYVVPEHEQLVLIMDADLYSSTSYVLRYLRPHIRPGTLIYFDEMNHLDHEPKAFDEFMKQTGLGFRAVAADRTLTCAFFECVGQESGAGTDTAS